MASRDQVDHELHLKGGVEVTFAPVEPLQFANLCCSDCFWICFKWETGF